MQQSPECPVANAPWKEVALEGAYAERTDAQTLFAWTLLLDGSRAARQRASHAPTASESQGAAGLMLRLDTAWEHFFARRLEQAWSDGRSLYREHPRLSPFNDFGLYCTKILALWTQRGASLRLTCPMQHSRLWAIARPILARSKSQAP